MQRRAPSTLLGMLGAALLLTGCASSGASGSEAQFQDAATFAATHRFTVEVPDGAEDLKVWFAIPDPSDPHQRLVSFNQRTTLSSAHNTRRVRDELGNEFLLLEAKNPAAGSFEVSTEFELERVEVSANLDPSATRAHTAEELAEHAADLAPSMHAIITPEMREMAAKAVKGETNPILKARRIYDAVLHHVQYHVKDPRPNSEKVMGSSGTGSSLHAFEQCTGNCTDIHALYASLSRASGLPTRAVYGSFFKGPLDGKDQDQSYHCWIEFHAPNIGWIPLDVAVADVFEDSFVANEHSGPRAALTTADGYDGPSAELVDYYFGNLDSRRVVWHRGRDLVMRNPRQNGGPLPWLPKAYAEIDGKSASVARKLTYSSR